MLTLATELMMQGRAIKQLKRDGMIAMFQMYGPEGDPRGYEVVVIQVVKEQNIFGRHYAEHEALPPASRWGTDGFSYLSSDRAGAERSFQQLVRKHANSAVPHIASENRPKNLENDTLRV